MSHCHYGSAALPAGQRAAPSSPVAAAPDATGGGAVGRYQCHSGYRSHCGSLSGSITSMIAFKFNLNFNFCFVVAVEDRVFSGYCSSAALVRTQ